MKYWVLMSAKHGNGYVRVTAGSINEAKAKAEARHGGAAMSHVVGEGWGWEPEKDDLLW